ncbi:MAG: two-component regulator propeller domain-containing protein, partial [Lentimicrobiaceae bacterium]|nr:two-component regulator propeller domain-containing protein [Lentimicrobiaceae bacterium]
MKYIYLRLASLFIFSVMLLNLAVGQEIGIGQWRDHLPYQKVIAVARGEGRIYAATPYSLFYYDEADYSLNRLGKINGLSDVGVSSIQYHTGLHTLVVAYTNGNIDLVTNDVVLNLSDIKRKTILGNKSINRITLIDDDAYLACGFGIVVLDIKRREFKGTYLIGPEGSAINVNDIDWNRADSTIYAVADEGIYRANIFTANLANYAEWEREFAPVLPAGPYNHVAVLNQRVYVNRKGPGYANDAMFVKSGGVWSSFQPDNTSNHYSMNVFNERLVVSNNLAVDVFRPDGTMQYRVYTYNPGNVSPADAMLDEDNVLWIGDQLSGLTRVESPNAGVEIFMLDGPAFSEVYQLASRGNDLWVVPGGRSTSFGNLYRKAQFAGFMDGKWKTVTSKQDTLLDSMRDLLAVAIDPANNKRVYIGTWGYGLLQYFNGQLEEHYTDENSTLEKSVLGGNWIGIGGLAFDDSKNLWVANSSATAALSMRSQSGEWTSFNLGPLASGLDLAELMIDKQNQKWLRTRSHNLVVFNDNNTPFNPSDDQTRRLSSATGNGALPGNFILSMATDRDGYVWLGSDK